MDKNYSTSVASLFERIQEIGRKEEDNVLSNATKLSEGATQLGSHNAITHITLLRDGEKKERIIRSMFDGFPYGERICANLINFSENPKALEEMLLVDINALLKAESDEITFPGFLASFSNAFFQPSLSELVTLIGQRPKTDFHAQWETYKPALFSVAYLTERGDLVESTAKILLSYPEEAELISQFISKITKSATQLNYSVIIEGEFRSTFVGPSKDIQAQRQGRDRTINRALTFLENADPYIRKDIGKAVKNLNPMAIYNVMKVLHLYQRDPLLPQIASKIEKDSKKVWWQNNKVIETCHSYLINAI
jgi:hypothetical protein